MYNLSYVHLTLLSYIVSWPFKEWTGVSHHWLLAIVLRFRSVLPGPRSLLRSPSPSLPKLPSPAQPSCPSLWMLFSQPLTVFPKLLLLLLSQFQNPLTYRSATSSPHLPSYLYQICFPYFICSSQTTDSDLPALLSHLLLQPQFPSQSTGFQPPTDILFCSS